MTDRMKWTIHDFSREHNGGAHVEDVAGCGQCCMRHLSNPPVDKHYPCREDTVTTVMLGICCECQEAAPIFFNHKQHAYVMDRHENAASNQCAGTGMEPQAVITRTK